MPLLTQPNLIEQSDFSGGHNPDQETPSAAANTLQDVSNLLPELGGTGALVAREGFRRIMEELGATSSHYVKNIHPFKGNSTSYLIVVMTDGLAAANNVRLFAINMSTLTVARIDTVGTTWTNPTKPHWGIGIDEIYYGGSPGNKVYSWNPVGAVWDADATTDPNWKTWVDAVDDAVTIATQHPRDFAFNGKEIVIYSGSYYAPADNIRHDTWESGQRYKRGDKVSRKTIWVTTNSYWKSFECIKAHTAGATTDQPGTGATWTTYWKKIRLPAPINADNETSKKWYFVPVAVGTSVAEWHADRLWMRYDSQGDKSRVLYSAPIDFEKDENVPNTTWDPTDFAPGNDKRGVGGGWLPFNDGKKGGVIEAMRSYGQYLVVFKRQAVWTLSGRSDESFTPRLLAKGVGAVGPDCVDELDGLLYFLSDDGLYVTDGTAVEPVPGFEKFANTIEARIDAMVATSDDIDPQLVVFDDRIWISFPNADAAAGEKYWTLVYEPRTGSIWKTNLPVIAMHTARHLGVPNLYFAAPLAYSGVGGDLIYQYDHASASNQDDTGAGVYAGVNIAWHLRTAWWPFGLLREQRRVRRIWAVVKGAMTYTLKAYRDWNDTEVKTTTRVVAGSNPVHIEGEYFADSHAVSFRLSSTARPASIYGVAVQTQPRRERYHI